MQFIQLKKSFNTCLWFLIVVLLMNIPAFVVAQDNQTQLDTIKQLIYNFVAAQASNDEQIEIQIASFSSKIQEKPAEWTISCSKRGIISGKTVFTLTATEENDKLKTVQVVADVKRFVPVYVLNKSVDRHYVIQPNDLELVTREITWPAREHAVTLQEATGMRTTRQIISGRILTSSMIEAIPVVERGKNLSMQVVEKNLYLEIPVISQGQGYRGEVIKVRNATADAYYLAQIKDENTVIYQSTKR